MQRVIQRNILWFKLNDLWTNKISSINFNFYVTASNSLWSHYLILILESKKERWSLPNSFKCYTNHWNGFYSQNNKIKVKISFLLMLDNNCRVAMKTESARLSENHFEEEHQKPSFVNWLYTRCFCFIIFLDYLFSVVPFSFATLHDTAISKSKDSLRFIYVIQETTAKENKQINVSFKSSCILKI